MPGPGRPFLPGNNANPHGRPRGSRHRLSESFLAAFCEDFEEHGADAIARTRMEDPAAYLRAAVAILPKQIEEIPNPFNEWTDDELETLGAFLTTIRDGEGW
jgi:hypothetical protein